MTAHSATFLTFATVIGELTMAVLLAWPAFQAVREVNQHTNQPRRYLGLPDRSALFKLFTRVSRARTEVQKSDWQHMQSLPKGAAKAGQASVLARPWPGFKP